MKYCRKCEEMRPLVDFSVVKGKPYSYCKKCKASDDKSYQERNKGRVLLKAKNYREANKLTVLKKVKEWHAKYPEKVRLIKGRWKRNNPEAARTYEATRRARKRGAVGKYVQLDVLNLFAAQKGKCAICSVSLVPGYHVDHVIPLALGGENSKGNIQLLCPPCNVFKGAKDPIAHAKAMGMLV